MRNTVTLEALVIGRSGVKPFCADRGFQEHGPGAICALCDMSQENGHHCDTRWIELRSDTHAILVEPGKPLGFGGSNFIPGETLPCPAGSSSDARRRPSRRGHGKLRAGQPASIPCEGEGLSPGLPDQNPAAQTGRNNVRIRVCGDRISSSRMRGTRFSTQRSSLEEGMPSLPRRLSDRPQSIAGRCRAASIWQS